MAEVVKFDNRIFIEPSVASRIVSNISNFGSPSSFGNICIIDDGDGAGYGQGKGAYGASSGRELSEFLQEFNSASEMKQFVRGGRMWDLADNLFNPSTQGRGASKVFYIRACKATTAKMTYTTVGADDLIINTLAEGEMANGTIETISAVKYLKTGYGMTIEAGDTASTYVFKFWRGIYKGADSDGLLYSGTPLADEVKAPELLATSVECLTLDDFIAWAQSSEDFNAYFSIDAGSDLTGALAVGDISGFETDTLFSGATETYDTTSFDHVMSVISELDNSFFFSTKAGANADSANNLKIISHINNDAEFKKFLIVGGGLDGTKFTQADGSVPSAETLNTPWCILVHSGYEITYPLGGVIPNYTKDAAYTAALVCGRLSGLEPQTPLTFKQINVGSMLHVLTQAQREVATQAGVLHIRQVPQLGQVVNGAINTLQLNTNMVNNDGTSYEISIMRIQAQMNKELNQFLLPNFIGSNIGNVLATDLETSTEGYLQSIKKVEGGQDGMIVYYGNVKASRTGTTWYITYDFQANTPINKIFTTGTIVDLGN